MQKSMSSRIIHRFREILTSSHVSWLCQSPDQQKIECPGATHGDFQWLAAWKDDGSCEARLNGWLDGGVLEWSYPHVDGLWGETPKHH